MTARPAPGQEPAALGNPLEIQNRHQLAGFLAGRTDDEIAAIVAELGFGRVLETIFHRMVDEYLPAEGPRDRSVIQWDVEGPDGMYLTWQNFASREGLTVAPGDAEEPDVTLRIEMLPFLGLMAGTLRGIEVLSAGTLRLKGSLQLAMEMEAWFAVD